MTTRRLRAAALVAVLVAVAAATSAAASVSAAGVQITQSPLSNFPDMAFAVSLPSDQELSAQQVRVRENGRPVRDVTVTKPGAENSATILVIDTSKSMEGQSIEQAMVAARAFAERRSTSQPLGVVFFNDDVIIRLPPTTDQASIDAALAKVPPLAQNTHIYDAIQRTGTLLKESGITNGSIVLLSDGKDVGSKVDRETAIDAVRDAQARVFAVGLHSSQFDPSSLQNIADKTSGNYSEAATAAALSQIYSELGYTLAHEYLLRYRSLAGPDADIHVAVRVDGIPGAARTSYTTPALAEAAASPQPSGWDRAIRSTITLIVVILVVAALLGYAAFRLVYRPHQELTRRIGQFVTLPQDTHAKEPQLAVTPVPGDERGRSDGWLQRQEDELAMAGIEMPVRTILLLTGVGGLIIGIVCALLLGSPVGLLAILIAPLVTRAIINNRLRERRLAFADQLPENLDVISSGLRSGHSFVGALAVCVDDAEEPAKSEFKRVIADEQLGLSVDEALHTTGQRMQNRDIVQVALVAKLQREAGTGAAEVLDQVSENIRARLELRRLISSLTAQGRMARWIVSLLPILLFLAIFLFNRDYVRPLWTDPVGITGLIAAAVMVIAGSLVIKRIVNIEV